MTEKQQRTSSSEKPDEDSFLANVLKIIAKRKGARRPDDTEPAKAGTFIAAEPDLGEDLTWEEIEAREDQKRNKK